MSLRSATLVALPLILLPSSSVGQASLGGQVGGIGSDLVIEAGNLVRIAIWPDATLGGEFPVENTGEVYLPILGEVPAAGLTLEEFRRDLRSRYAEAMRTPIVSVNVAFSVSVLGAVQRPSLYLADATSTIFDLISEAGGFRDDADLEKLRILRRDEVVHLDAESAFEADASALALALRPGDRIIVPRRPGLNLRDILAIVQTAAVATTVIITLTRN